MPAPRRRHRVAVDLEADDLSGLAGALNFLADEITVNGGDHRDISYAGFEVTYRATLRTDRDQTGDRYREQFARWRRRRRRWLRR